MHIRAGLMSAIRGPADELRAIAERARAAWRNGRRPVAAEAAGALSVLGWVLYGSRNWRHVALDTGGVYANLPLHVELVRLPASAFLPTPSLPLPLAVGQLLIVVGTAEILLGTRATVAVAMIGHTTGTLLARLLVTSASLDPFGLPVGQARVLDTGPSVVTTAVGTWLLLRFRAHWSLTMLGCGLAIFAVMQNNLDTREHMAALLVGALAATVPARLRTVAARARTAVVNPRRTMTLRLTGPRERRAVVHPSDIDSHRDPAG